MEKEFDPRKIYLILGNAKKATLIFSLFTPFDLILFGTGIAVTFLLFMIFSASNITSAILVSLPLLITGFLVFPLPNYHNVRMFIISSYKFFTERRMYKWRGWCYKYDESAK